MILFHRNPALLSPLSNGACLLARRQTWPLAIRHLPSSLTSIFEEVGRSLPKQVFWLRNSTTGILNSGTQPRMANRYIPFLAVFGKMAWYWLFQAGLILVLPWET